jgi:hypothetical protein
MELQREDMQKWIAGDWSGLQGIGVDRGVIRVVDFLCIIGNPYTTH